MRKMKISCVNEGRKKKYQQRTTMDLKKTTLGTNPLTQTLQFFGDAVDDEHMLRLAERGGRERLTNIAIKKQTKHKSWTRNHDPNVAGLPVHYRDNAKCTRHAV